MRRLLLAVGLCLALTGWATEQQSAPPIERYKADEFSQAEQRLLLAGSWFSEAPLKDGGTRLQLTKRNLDGTFVTTFRLIAEDGSFKQQTEVGLWGVSGPVYFTITRGWKEARKIHKADPTDASLNDAYQILELNEQRFRYRSWQSGSEYRLERVSEDFTFPK